MRELNEAEVAEIVGAVTAGPNGEGCTEPRKDNDPYKTLAEIILSAAGV